MLNIEDAKYFDGKSSAHQLVQVNFDEISLTLYFKSGEENLVWKGTDLKFEKYGNSIEIRNKNYPEAILKIENKAFYQKFYEAMKLNKRVDIHTRLLRLGFFKLIAVAIGIFGLMVLSYFYILPPIAERSAMLLPEEFDNKIGNTFESTFLEQQKIDYNKTKLLETFASKLDLANTKPLQFTVVQSEEINAFALPNGRIVVFTGILNQMKTSDELVALLGHEASHINHRHSTRTLCRNLGGYMMVSLLLSDVNGIMAVLTENAQQLHSLSYSRKFEQEADEQGLQILMNNKANPNGMINLFERIESEDERLSNILSTHPLTKDRRDNIRKIISKSNYKVQPNEALISIFEKIKQ
ncbi:M48 family metallopeptidase [Riemerella anatipestifer]|uniref:M48 family metallopeptidase n=1 Tax=Riemerella anatipestifer TaxID=34085 RepID=UPI0030BD5D39